MNEAKKKCKELQEHRKILIPLLYDYYLFNYFKFLVPKLIAHGFKVTILTIDPKIEKQYSDLCTDDSMCRIVRGPRWLRVCLNRSGQLPFRLLLWCCGWIWAESLKRHYHFAILPWDNKPYWYVIAVRIPSLTVHTVTNLSNLKGYLDHESLSEHVLQRPVFQACLFLDRLLGRRFLPRARGCILKFVPSHLILDRVMGWWARNTIHGFGKVQYLTVTGSRIRENYQACGLIEPKIFSIGSPSYEHVLERKASFTAQQRVEIRKELGLDVNRPLFSFFLSPSDFSEIQLNEVVTVIDSIRKKNQDSQFLLKFHPKTVQTAIKRFKNALTGYDNDVRFVVEFFGDDHNTLLVLASDFLLQKQGTVGFIAMLCRLPIISYNFYTTDDDDDMYENIGGSFHVRDVSELNETLDRLTTPEGLAESARRQQFACENFCCENFSPCTEIVKIISDHLRQEPRKLVKGQSV